MDQDTTLMRKELRSPPANIVHLATTFPSPPQSLSTPDAAGPVVEPPLISDYLHSEKVEAGAVVQYIDRHAINSPALLDNLNRPSTAFFLSSSPLQKI